MWIACKQFQVAPTNCLSSSAHTFQAVLVPGYTEKSALLRWVSSIEHSALTFPRSPGPLSLMAPGLFPTSALKVSLSFLWSIYVPSKANMKLCCPP